MNSTFIDDFNKSTPNVLDNDTDQAPKTGEYYEKRLNSTKLNTKIIEAFDNFCKVDGDPEIVQFFEENINYLPMEQIVKLLKEKGSVAYEINRTKKKEDIGISNIV